jgi:hypothetical protein
MLLSSDIKQKNNDPSAKYRQRHWRVAVNLLGCIRDISHSIRGQGVKMKKSSVKRNYLFGAFGGIIIFLLGASIGPAFAQGNFFTDINGNTCMFSQLIPGGPGGQSICPTGSTALRPGENQKAFEQRVQQEELEKDLQFKYNIQQIVNGLLGVSPEAPILPPPTNYNNRNYGQLGMYVSNGGMSGDVTASGGGYSLRNGGVSMSDTAGLVAPGAQSSSYRENGGGGGVSGTYDASRFVGANQHLVFNGAFDYTSSNTNFGGVGTGSSINSNNYSFTGIGLYSNYNTYLALGGSYQFGNNTEFTSSDNSTGSYRSDGYDIDATVGHVFWLMNTISQPATSRMAVKALPKPSDGYAIGLDLSGHLGYASDVAKGFTDSSGFVFGDERVQGGETGLKARLFATVLNNGLVWTPYVTGTVDWRFNYSHISSFPGQIALATGDTVVFDDATTFVGAQVGLDVKTTYGWTVGVNGFYDHSSDTEIVGGKAYVKIPLGPAVVTARY